MRVRFSLTGHGYMSKADTIRLSAIVLNWRFRRCRCELSTVCTAIYDIRHDCRYGRHRSRLHDLDSSTSTIISFMVDMCRACGSDTVDLIDSKLTSVCVKIVASWLVFQILQELDKIKLC